MYAVIWISNMANERTSNKKTKINRNGCTQTCPTFDRRVPKKMLKQEPEENRKKDQRKHSSRA